MNYDIIIIGAGLGGLTAGAKLAKQGKKGPSIEQHDRPGDVPPPSPARILPLRWACMKWTDPAQET
jgi:flavin-dependent dehydrogenase